MLENIKNVFERFSCILFTFRNRVRLSHGQIVFQHIRHVPQQKRRSKALIVRTRRFRLFFFFFLVLFFVFFFFISSPGFSQSSRRAGRTIHLLNLLWRVHALFYERNEGLPILSRTGISMMRGNEESRVLQRFSLFGISEPADAARSTNGTTQAERFISWRHQRCIHAIIRSSFFAI